MPTKAGGMGKLADKGKPGFGADRGAARGEELEGQRQQRIAGQDRRGLIKSAMERRLAAPEFIVIHRGQVVMDERIAVDEFERAARALRLGLVAVEERSRCADEIGPDALAAAERRITHGVEEPILIMRVEPSLGRGERRRLADQEPVESGLGTLGSLGKIALEMIKIAHGGRQYFLFA